MGPFKVDVEDASRMPWLSTWSLHVHFPVPVPVHFQVRPHAQKAAVGGTTDA
ncbi:hypothetical protein K443DRAFT_683262 [Laccaria amethystina LaAM-08-1]|uniref:Unplaced genomic scaffold K443scaffold_231, whole genome shotgun sequence n=1 Tax=Laccaria amethystina LaAM-08-1 TaxID=1095629 RepID=A0A0C9XBM0_9AGAR|nr:hypothetical protein K443DRAFT_683262 [Laccaria amethystina LaAM-08-1]